MTITAGTIVAVSTDRGPEHGVVVSVSNALPGELVRFTVEFADGTRSSWSEAQVADAAVAPAEPVLLGVLIAASSAITAASDYETAEVPYFAARRAFYDAEDGDGVTATERAAWSCVMEAMRLTLDRLAGPVVALVALG